MILYELRCTSGHGFEGWFRNSGTYEQQAAAHEIACPICQDTGISKAPMAPRVARSVPAPKSESAVEAVAPEKPAETSTLPVPAGESVVPVPAAPPMPTQMQAVHFLRTLRRVVESHCENVGEGFAEEARKIHDGEAPARGIYGNTSPEKAQELADDGIEFVQIPWLRTSDA